jgi:para-aminobenzoate synthetase component 1
LPGAVDHGVEYQPRTGADQSYSMHRFIAEKLRIIPLIYHPDSASWYSAIRHLPNPVWLDSGRPASSYGRYDILCAAPQWLLETKGENTRISDSQGNWCDSTQDPFYLLRDFLGDFSQAQSKPDDLPFIGGALGYFGYDLGRRLEKLPALAKDDIALPDMRAGIYPWAIIQDHQNRTACLIINEALGEMLNEASNSAYNFLEIEQICQTASQKTMFHDLKQSLRSRKNTFKINTFEDSVKVDEYRLALIKIQEYIRAGDCYQVNFAQRFSAEFGGDPFVAYQVLRAALPSPFSGFMEFEGGAVLSLSPEQFIGVRGKQVQTKPIKGTIKRGLTPEDDAANAQWLQNSLKNRAENVMIVDLLRNDLSKHCTDVRVPKLCELQTFANVHHLVSTVTGELSDGATAIDVLRDAFPGGSITGAPKIRAMEIIEELEPTRRSLYCGSLGYLSADGQMDTSIAIRTLVCDGNKIHCWGGGGIVADSETEQEYRESIAKVQVLMETLEQHFKN